MASGSRHLIATQAIYQDTHLNVRLVPFIEDMAEAYAWADLVICRSGALTVAEIAAVGVPALFIPFPAAIDDHQTYNALYLVSKGAAELLPQASLDAAKLAARIQDLGSDRQKLLTMANTARKESFLQATEHFIQHCREIVKRG